MRILILQKTSGPGGAVSSLLETIQACKTFADIDAEVLVSEQGPFVDECRELEVPVHKHPLPDWRKWQDRVRFPAIMQSIADSIPRGSIQYVLSNSPAWAPHAEKLGELLGCRSGSWVRDSLTGVRPGDSPLAKELHCVFTTSDGLRNELGPFLEDYPGVVETLYDAVEAPASTPEGSLRTEQFLKRFSHVDRWLLCLGSVSPKSNQVEVLRVLKSVSTQSRTKWGCVIGGRVEQSYSRDLDAAINKLGLEDRVCMLGHWDDVGALFQRATALVIAGKRDGLPRSVIEALRAGLPAFSMPFSEMDEIYGEHMEHFVCDEASPESLAHLILSKLSEPELMGRFLGDLRRTLEARFSGRVHAEKLLSVLSRA